MNEKNTIEYLMSLKPVTEIKSYLQARPIIMDYAISQISFDGVVCEFGVASGTSARHLISKLPEETSIYLFDSFEGLPEDWVGEKKKGRYKVDIIPVFKELNVAVIIGWFEDTLPDFNIHKPISFAHMDADIYSATITVLKNIDCYLKKGSILLFDEFFGYGTCEEHEQKALYQYIKKYDRDFEYIARTEIGQIVIRILK